MSSFKAIRNPLKTSRTSRASAKTFLLQYSIYSGLINIMSVLSPSTSTITYEPSRFFDSKRDPDNNNALLILNQPISSKTLLHRVWLSTSYRICADGGANRLYDLFDRHENLAERDMYVCPPVYVLTFPTILSQSSTAATKLCLTGNTHSPFHNIVLPQLHHATDHSNQSSPTASTAISTPSSPRSPPSTPPKACPSPATQTSKAPTLGNAWP